MGPSEFLRILKQFWPWSKKTERQIRFTLERVRPTSSTKMDFSYRSHPASQIEEVIEGEEKISGVEEPPSNDESEET